MYRVLWGFVKTISPVGTRYTLCKCVSEVVEIANCISSTFVLQTPLVSKNFREREVCFLNVIFLNGLCFRRCRYSSGYQDRLIDANRQMFFVKLWNFQLQDRIRRYLWNDFVQHSFTNLLIHDLKKSHRTVTKLNIAYIRLNIPKTSVKKKFKKK